MISRLASIVCTAAATGNSSPVALYLMNPAAFRSLVLRRSRSMSTATTMSNRPASASLSILAQSVPAPRGLEAETEESLYSATTRQPLSLARSPILRCWVSMAYPSPVRSWEIRI